MGNNSLEIFVLHFYLLLLDSIRQISEEKEELPAQSAGTTVVNVSADDDLTNSQSDDNKASLISTGDFITGYR